MGHDAKPGMSDGLSMTEVRSAIRQVLAGQENFRLPSPRNILSLDSNGTTLANPIVDFTGKSKRRRKRSCRNRRFLNFLTIFQKPLRLARVVRIS